VTSQPKLLECRSSLKILDKSSYTKLFVSLRICASQGKNEEQYRSLAALNEDIGFHF